MLFLLFLTEPRYKMIVHLKLTFSLHFG